MNFLLAALLLGVVSMFIVLVSGFFSGVVSISTIAVRAGFAFAMTSAAVYFLLMLFDYFNESNKPAETEETPESSEVPPEPEGFQPMNAANLPNVEK